MAFGLTASVCVPELSAQEESTKRLDAAGVDLGRILGRAGKKRLLQLAGMVQRALVWVELCVGHHGEQGCRPSPRKCFLHVDKVDRNEIQVQCNATWAACVKNGQPGTIKATKFLATAKSSPAAQWLVFSFCRRSVSADRGASPAPAMCERWAVPACKLDALTCACHWTIAKEALSHAVYAYPYPLSSPGLECLSWQTSMSLHRASRRCSSCGALDGSTAQLSRRRVISAFLPPPTHHYNVITGKHHNHAYSASILAVSRFIL